jgi:hypothetical protein
MGLRLLLCLFLIALVTGDLQQTCLGTGKRLIYLDKSKQVIVPVANQLINASYCRIFCYSSVFRNDCRYVGFALSVYHLGKSTHQDQLSKAFTPTDF